MRLGLVLVALAAALAVVVPAGPASAHASLVGTDPVDGAVLPQAPDQVVFTFNETVRLTGQPITVYDADGRQVDSTATASGSEVTVVPEEELTDGTYVVGWFVLSADGHPVSGSLTFSVGERSDVVVTPPPPPESSQAVVADRGRAPRADVPGTVAGGRARVLRGPGPSARLRRSAGPGPGPAGGAGRRR